jgi:hypothetical protein
MCAQKNRQHNCYTLAYPKNNDTNILPDSFKKTTDESSVSCNDNFTICDAIRKQVRLERLARYFLIQ